MTRRLIPLLMIGLFALTVATPATADAFDGDVARWNFDVYLNDKKVGKHLFEVSDDGELTRVRSEAKFKYKILFIPAYRYEHTNSERWADNCLVQFSAETNANGEQISAYGEKDKSGFRVTGSDGALELPECVMTFAYWNPTFLEQERLLNPQSGEYVDVEVEQLEPDVVEVRGAAVPATRYRLTAENVSLTLWYSDDDEWLALESVAPGGHIIRYELS